jgi:hypothetical protein
MVAGRGRASGLSLQTFRTPRTDGYIAVSIDMCASAVLYDALYARSNRMANAAKRSMLGDLGRA